MTPLDVYFKLLYKSMPGVVVSTYNRFLYLPEAFLFIKRLGNFTECYNDCSMILIALSCSPSMCFIGVIEF